VRALPFGGMIGASKGRDHVIFINCTERLSQTKRAAWFTVFVWPCALQPRKFVNTGERKKQAVRRFLAWRRRAYSAAF
jgi:hypothetical protein